MLPYLGWTCFATTLINCSLWDSNPAVVQSAHNVAQVRPQEPTDRAQPKPLHKRNITCPADIGKVSMDNAALPTGGIQYSNQPILGRIISGEQFLVNEWGGPPAHNTQQAQPQARQQQQQQRPWDVRAEDQGAAHTPFSADNLHRRSATQADKRVTRRTTDDNIGSDRRVTHTDSGHLIIPQWSGDKPERKDSGLASSGLFARVRPYPPHLPTLLINSDILWHHCNTNHVCVWCPVSPPKGSWSCMLVVSPMLGGIDLVTLLALHSLQHNTAAPARPSQPLHFLCISLSVHICRRAC